MSKLYQLLEQTFKGRINSNAEIIPYIKKLSESGKFDEPKKVAAIAILLDRLGKMEDEVEAEKSLHEITSSVPMDEPKNVNPLLNEKLLQNSILPDVATSSDQAPGDVDEITTTIHPQVKSGNSQPDITVSEFTPDTITDTPAIPDDNPSTTS